MSLNRETPHSDQQGFLTFAENTDKVDYLTLAYVQAMSIKITHPNSKCAVIVNTSTMKNIVDKHRAVFNYIIEVPDAAKKFHNQWRMFWLTPFKETIYIESDLLLTRNLDHWWDSYRLRDICLSTGCKNFLQQNVSPVRYRELFVKNNLPDVYGGMMYFRYSIDAARFFTAAWNIQNEWHDVQLMALKTRVEPSPDLVYALAARMIGVEKCTLPSLEFLNFVHMKPGVQEWSDSQSWMEHVMIEENLPIIRINNMNQYHPFHYYEKGYITEERITLYEQRLGQSRGN